MLIDNRKFDIRCYGLILSCGDAYIYDHGYLRLSSAEYSTDTADARVHLTNNAVQKHLDTYCTFEDGNMLHFSDLCAYMKTHDPSLSDTYFLDVIWPRIKSIMILAISAAGEAVKGAAACDGCFELFGFDFMITSREDGYRPFLIEVNSNPCLELSSGVSWDILPRMLDDLMDICVDGNFPPPRVCLDQLSRAKVEAQHKERPVASNTFTKKHGSLDDMWMLRWNAVTSPDAPVVQRPNWFQKVMVRWRVTERCLQGGRQAEDRQQDIRESWRAGKRASRRSTQAVPPEGREPRRVVKGRPENGSQREQVPGPSPKVVPPALPSEGGEEADPHDQ